jgi:predicted DNA-binding ribbon-helix-helix protein
MSGARRAPVAPSRLVKRSFSLAGHRTSVALEQEFWAALSDIDAAREPGQPLASALRVLALRAFFRPGDPGDR